MAHGHDADDLFFIVDLIEDSVLANPKSVPLAAAQLSDASWARLFFEAEDFLEDAFSQGWI